MPEDSLRPRKIVAMVLAGGRVGELSVLTLARPKAAMPFGGHYRIIDFPLSNLMHAGIAHVGILSQYRPASLIDHVRVGESWDFVGLERGAKILPPFRGAEASDWYRGNADAIYRNLNYIRDHGAEQVVILSGDHIYRMDLRAMLDFHDEHDADLTVAFKRMGPNVSQRFGYGEIAPDGRLVSYEEKPPAPRTDLASLTIYVAEVGPLSRALEACVGLESYEFGRDVIPQMLARDRVFGYEFDGYWAYARTIDSYYEAMQDLILGRIDIDEWGVRTNLADSGVANVPPTRIDAGAAVRNSLISPGCVIEGTVRGSVLSPGVRIGRGAIVDGSAVFNRSVIEPGASVERSILDKDVLVGERSRVGGPPLVGAEPVAGRPSSLG
ncbi:MAG: glucose-1-phosphate adenylyltransferase, partial [Candidatus Latescibacteria bacterium]|nr:glucose-1-phosphate adenylyltransferase [Candidatus Latescibacterota bacterium]